MIAYLKGKIKDVFESSVILDVNGVGYEVYCTEKECASFFNKEGEEVGLYTHYYLRENSAELYGFANMAEKKMFGVLINISGVGPKGAMSILSAAPLEALQRAISEGDPSVLTKVSGIGNKIAQKIILELKDKFGEEWAGLGGDIRGDSEVVEALESLGYSKAQVQDVLKNMPESITSTEGRIREALKLLQNS